MSHQTCVLLYGKDEVLLKTRGMILERAAYRIRLAMEAHQLEEILEKEEVDLTILCYSLSIHEICGAVEAVHDVRPDSKIIALRWESGARDSSSAVVVFNNFSSPVALIATVARILNQPNIESMIH